MTAFGIMLQNTVCAGSLDAEVARGEGFRCQSASWGVVELDILVCRGAVFLVRP